jgi:peptidoglycan hydrolase CwlO-like protein
MLPDTADPEGGRRNRWIWISALLAVVAAGLLVWALSAQSDDDSTQQQLADTQAELESTQEQLAATQAELDSTKQDLEQLQSAEDEDAEGGKPVLAAGAAAAGAAVIDDLADELGATQEDLAGVEQDLEAANAKARAASEDAAAAEERAAQASDETERAQAEADQARAEAEAAEARAAIAADCAKAFVTAIGTLFEGDDMDAQADAVRKQLEGITADCKAALAET